MCWCCKIWCTDISVCSCCSACCTCVLAMTCTAVARCQGPSMHMLQSHMSGTRSSTAPERACILPQNRRVQVCEHSRTCRFTLQHLCRQCCLPLRPLLFLCVHPAARIQNPEHHVPALCRSNTRNPSPCQPTTKMHMVVLLSCAQHHASPCSRQQSPPAYLEVRYLIVLEPIGATRGSGHACSGMLRP